jgi:uncharacterized coiled-coil DUF342 family protein
MKRREQRAAEFNDADTQMKDEITSKYAEMTGYVKERDRTRRQISELRQKSARLDQIIDRLRSETKELQELVSPDLEG